MDKEKTRILAHSPHGDAALRHPWGVAAVAAVSLLSMVAAFAVAPSATQIEVPQVTVVQPVALPQPLELMQTDMVFIREERVEHGDTAASLLRRVGVDDEAALDFIRGSRDAAPLLRELRAGRTISVKTDDQGRLLSLAFPLSGKDEGKALFVERRGQGLEARTQALELETRVLMKSAEVRSSLFAATDEAGLPDGVAQQLAEIFGAEIDFHSELRRGDRFSVVYEMLYHQGQPLRTGRILAAQFVNDGRSYDALYYGDGHGRGNYYDRGGKSLRKAFLRSPLEFSRISSGFSMSRTHPVFQDVRAHKGVDYSAPTGTRVKATAEGEVEFAGRQNGYGNLVVLRHRDGYSTAYGHLNGFAAGLRKGARVAQGEVIGYVGQTGWATGPHLHYEFRVNGVHRNPLTMAMPDAIPLDARQLTQFRSDAEPLLLRLSMIRPGDASLN